MREINFFNEYKGREKEQSNTLVYVLLVAIVVFIGYTYLRSTLEIKGIENNIAELEGKLNDPKMKEQVALSDDVNQKLTILSQVETSLEELDTAVKSRDVISAQLLNQISSTLPSEISFKNIVISNGNITISAVSTSRKAIAEIQHNLKELSFIRDVYINTISELGGLEGQYSFDLQCVLGGGSES